MSLWKIAWRSIQQRAVASALTAFAMGLGVALVVAVLVIYGVIDKSFRRGSQGYDLIVGAKGSSLQLVLNTVFHIGESPQPIPYSFYEKLNRGDFGTAVDTVVPVCMGHDYKGAPVIATIPDMFDRLRYLNDQRYEFVEGGRNFRMKAPFEAVVGSMAAQKTGLKVGDTFEPTHGGAAAQEPDDGKGHHHKVKVVGILKHTGTPNDQAIFMNIEGFYQFGCHTGGPTRAEQLLNAKPAQPKPEPPPKPKRQGILPGLAPEPAEEHGHEEHAHADHAAEHEHAEHVHGVPMDQRRVSAILVCTNQDERSRLGMALPDIINNGPVAQAVFPAKEIHQLFERIIGNIQLVLLILASVVVVVAGVGILVSIYNSMSDRRHEIAIMRALGANRMIVGTVILLEAILLSLGGGLFGVLLGHGLVGILGPTIAAHTGVMVSAWQFQTNELMLIPSLIILASIVGYLPAASAYRTDVAKSLTAGQ
ncbi:MAG: ABC transporter permease [Pirellulales bacterium]|nr:ABC transporter permease [Pirellulales bacterium]